MFRTRVLLRDFADLDCRHIVGVSVKEDKKVLLVIEGAVKYLRGLVEGE